MDRILKSGGRLILDYATDIRRVRPDGTLYVVEGEPNPSINEGQQFLRQCFPNYEIQIVTDRVAPEEVITPADRWRFNSNVILLRGEKLSGAV